jgi:L-fucose mutarotase
MLVGINPLLRGELLAALDKMGHGDILVIADANFPAHRISTAGVHDLPGIDAPTVAAAILTVFPLDADEPITLMTCPAGRQPVQLELLTASGDPFPERVEELGRHDFYRLAAEAAVVVQSGETRPYGNLLIRKAGITT